MVRSVAGRSVATFWFSFPWLKVRLAEEFARHGTHGCSSQGREPMMSQTAHAAAPTPAPALGDELDDLRAEIQRLRLEQVTDQRTIRDLSAAVAARDEFIAMVAHELRNPMGAIVVSASNMMYKAGREQGRHPGSSLVFRRSSARHAPSSAVRRRCWTSSAWRLATSTSTGTS